MKLQKTKKLMTILFASILLFTIFFTFTLTVEAADVTTYAFISAIPNPIGVNQNALISIWLQPIPPFTGDVFTGMSVSITKPDGTTETRGPFTSSAIGSADFSYTPTQIGTYTLQLSYAGETFPSTGDFFKPSTSPPYELTVQEDPVWTWPPADLPTDYWERPISAENREWSSIAGNWLMRGYNSTHNSFDSPGAFNPYSQAPRSAHIMWTKELAHGGIVGGEHEHLSHYTGLSYEWKIDPPLIINGKLYRNLWPGGIYGFLGPTDRMIGLEGFECLDLRTGEVLWQQDEGRITHGQLYNYVSGNQMGVHTYLWNIGVPEYTLYDAFTGDKVLTFENSMGGSVVYGEDGTMFVYILDGVANYMAMWNSTKAFDENGMIPVNVVGGWRPSKGTYDWTKGVEWNTTIPAGPPGLWTGIYGITGNVAVSDWRSTYTVPEVTVGYSIDTGQRLWVLDKEFSAPYIALGEGVFARFEATTMKWFGYNAQTGQQLWESDSLGYPWGTFLSENPFIAYGKLFTMGYDGYAYGIDKTTGETLWRTPSESSGYETPYGNYPFWYGPIVADHVLFAGTGEHSPTQPLIRGEKLFALDTETGEKIWSITGLMHTEAIADGYLLTTNAYDNRLYCFGKGPSATTVTAPKTEVVLGESVIIEGTVTDQSPGALGTPAISDADMGPWMEYLYMQKPFPVPHPRGVEVSIDVIDANSNFRNIGTATSDTSGKFGLMWEPDIPGMYTIIATFAGSESYGSSFDQTYMGVVDAPQPTPPPDPTPAPMTDTYVLGMGAAAIIVIIIFGLLILLMLRKR